MIVVSPKWPAAHNYLTANNGSYALCPLCLWQVGKVCHTAKALWVAVLFKVIVIVGQSLVFLYFGTSTRTTSWLVVF
jgi:hypothetical protein